MIHGLALFYAEAEQARRLATARRRRDAARTEHSRRIGFGKPHWGLAFTLALVVAGLLSVVWASAAQGAQAWKLDSVSNTTAVVGDTLLYDVEARNVGDVAMDPGSPTTFVASLPDGITAVDAFVSDSGTTTPCTAQNGVDPVLGQARIVCTTPLALPVQFSWILRLTVTVNARALAGATLMSEFGVSGGGATSASTVDPITIRPPLGFGVDAFDGQVTADPTGDAFTQAGGHPYAISTSIDFNTVATAKPLQANIWPAEPVKDLFVDLPPGLVGNPTGVAQCALAELAHSTGGTSSQPLCPPTSQVGTTFVHFNGWPGNSVLGPVPVYDVTPPSNVPARFGFNVAGSIVVLDAQVRSGGDYGLTIAAKNIPEGLAIAGTTVTFWGVPSDPSHDIERACPGFDAPAAGGPTCQSGAPPAAFLRNPTSCTDPNVGLVTTLRMDSWYHPGTFVGASFTSHNPIGYPFPRSAWGGDQGPTGCAKVPFDPTLAGTPAAPAKTASPSGFSFDVTLPQSDDPTSIGEADLKQAVVTLPDGLHVSPSAAHGLGACTSQQIALRSDSEPSCPSSSRVGSVTIDTPLLRDPLSGAVYLATPHDNPFDSLLAIYIVAHGPGVVLKLAGHVDPDPLTGQITTTFDDNPQLPFSNLHLEFNGGSGAPLATPRRCGTYSTEAELTSWSGKVVQTRSDFTLSHDGNGAPCPAPHFSPSFTAGTANPTAGRSTAFHLTFSRGDDDENLKAVTVNMPNGLTGKIANVDLCSDDAAKAGSCPEGSRVGRVTVGAGAGPNPFYIETGRAYLTGPYNGAPYGLAIVVPAVAGPFDLGNVTVRSSIFVDKHTAELRVVSDPLPQILQGIPLDVRDVRVSVDKSDFIVNPTSCAKKTISGVLDSTVAGLSAHVSSPFRVGDCASLPFKPRMALSVGAKGHTARGSTIPFSTKVTMPPGNANLRYVRVTLPSTINARLTVINRACTRVQYEAAKCEAARAGTAVANTPLLRDPLHGNVYFVKNGHPLPDLFIALRGQVSFDLIGRISIPGSTRLSTTFDAVPDVPIKSFSLNLVSGARGTVGAATNLCSSRGRNAKAALDFIGQNGRVKQVDQRMTVKGCTKHKTTRGRE